LEAPVIHRRVLDNGLTVLVVEKRDLPMRHASVVLKSGSAADPRDLPGLAGFVADMLKAGTRTRSAQAIADEVETMGATLDIGASEDAMFVGFTSLSDNFDPIFDVVA